ncbi:glutaredoxin 2 [Simonsiella muelleri]|uniref:glutaredoxin 2 n=1 Tax=Simonsiella muelleri TaxID=72 RepID=UPI0023F50354|nr:glutaredoxin 2 [Simonsiella muelleri]
MKLYIYDHCPFCVRARMIFGLREMATEEITLLNDDEITPINMIGVKQVPILQKSDGKYMGESLDIVSYINELSGHSPLESVRSEIQNWFEQVNAFYNRLVMPRSVQLGLAEFAKPSSVVYFIEHKKKLIGDFEENFHKTNEYITQMQQYFVELDALMVSEEWINGKELSLEDIIIFPILRNLTMVSGLNFPEKLLNYTHKMAKKSLVNLYFDCAI